MTHKFVSRLEYALTKCNCSKETIKTNYCPFHLHFKLDYNECYPGKDCQKCWNQPAKKDGKYILQRIKK